ncbi:iron-containing alcohol dehydrogenase [Paenibacillus oenotherae]|uniref:Iron-containing alcohol dehydrogenase n=1 Tax=Paenibacillus oenotherae TaxID=1435645 RepID=A0ABS7D4E4_9BACL|nr:iron-containing alcohol dehydrogenase [Paenibacillus oenotherae]MBW7474812.1 iron-containing alcohol dehydrogenase [Paenibacillus oenotherae]
MKDFTFYNPTKVEFGRDKENLIGSYMAPYGVKKALLVYGSERIKASGLFDRVAKSLGENGIEFVTLSGIKSNPVISKAREGVRIAKENSVDAVLAVGGGSVLDTAKVIAAGAVYDGDVWDLCSYKKYPDAALKIFDVLTLSATGSEMNATAVITNEETTEKFGFSSPAAFPTVSVINPELQETVTNEYLAYSGVDILSHCMDLYFTASYIPEMTANHIENIIRTVIRTTDILLNNPGDYEARSELAWAAAQALNRTTFAGVEGNRYDTHLIEHSLSALYDVPHGAGLAVVYPAWMNWHLPMNPTRYEQFARTIFGLQTAEEGIEALTNWFVSIGAPVKLEQVHIDKDKIEEIASHIYRTIEMARMQSLYPKETIVELLNRM